MHKRKGSKGLRVFLCNSKFSKQRIFQSISYIQRVKARNQYLFEVELILSNQMNAAIETTNS